MSTEIMLLALGAVRLLLPFLAGGAVGVPIGVWALPYLNPSHFKLAIGTMLLVCCLAMLFAPRLPPVTRGGRLGDAAAGAVKADMWPKFAVVAPALILPSMLGARIYVGLSPAAFRRLILCLLSLSSVPMMAAPLASILRA